MRRKRDLLIANVLAFVVLLAALLAGWREAAAFGLAVLVIMDLMALLGERWPRRSPRQEDSTEGSAELRQRLLDRAESGSKRKEPDA
jgi:hypothetical protein